MTSAAAIQKSTIEQASTAIVNGDQAAFSKILSVIQNPGSIVNAVTSSGQTVLGQAVSSGILKFVEICIERSTPAKKEDERTARSLSNSPPQRRKSIRDTEVGKHRGFVILSQIRSSSVELCSRVDVNRHDYFDRSPLHYAAELETKEILEYLLEKGATVNTSDANGLSPLHVSVSRNRLENVRILIRHASRLNAKSAEKQTPLHIAASYGYLEICGVLLTAGASVDALDHSERTPLMLAMQHKHLDVIRLLINHGANVNATEIHGESPLVASVWANEVELVQLLLKNGARIYPSDCLLQTAILHHNPELVNALLPYVPMPLARNSVGDTPQVIAVREKQFDIFLSLVLHGADLTTRNYIIGDTILHCLVRSFHEHFDLNLFKSFLKLLTDFNFPLFDETSFVQGENPLFLAVILSKLKFASLLIINGCDPNIGHAFTSKNIDILRVARRRGSIVFVQLLIDAGYNLHNRSEPITLPIPSEHRDIQQFLEYASKNPLSLKKLARLSLRSVIRKPFEENVEKLPLPTSVKAYLQFSEYLRILNI